jgi:predicted transporter
MVIFERGVIAMKQAPDPRELDTGVATVCLIVGFCVGLGLGVAALTTYVDSHDRP